MTNQFLRFDLTGEHEIELKPQTRYAFLLLFDEIGEDRSLSLANEYWGQYSGGHGIRREGTAREPWWENNAFPTNFTQRVAQPPATFGRPDVDTWRDLVFAVETQPVETASVEELKLVPFYALPNGKWVTEPHLPAGHTSPPAFKAIVSEIWPAGLVPLFAFQKETRMELRRLPARGEENVSEPAFFALPPLDEPDAGLIAGRWDCDATNHQGQVHQPNWELAVNDGKLSGRFDPHGEYRVAFITDGFFRTNTFQMITEFSNDRFILDAQMRDGALVGTYRQQDDSDHGTWVARRRGGVAVPSPMGAVPLYEWRKGDSIRYGITPPEKNSGWQRAVRPLGRVWQ
jgi:hypothetical protein